MVCAVAMSMQEPNASAEVGLARWRRDAIFANWNLLNLAKAKVERELCRQPNDARTLQQLGDLQRKLGDFGAASETYRKLKAVDDDAVAAWGAWCVGALNGKQLPAGAPEGTHPTPFVRTDFLTAAQQDVLLDAVRRGGERFAPAKVGNTGKGEVALHTRVALVAERSVRRQIRPWFVKELDRIVGDVFRHFRVEGMDAWHVELEVTAHRLGGFYRPHQDTGYGRADSRLVTFAYYFHREPKGFAGGDLLLYDTSIATGGFSAAAFSRIQPVNNSLVFFPSGYVHQVLPVYANGDAFENTRFTVNGWLHTPSSAAHRTQNPEQNHFPNPCTLPVV